MKKRGLTVVFFSFLGFLLETIITIILMKVWVSKITSPSEHDSSLIPSIISLILSFDCYIGVWIGCFILRKENNIFKFLPFAIALTMLSSLMPVIGNDYSINNLISFFFECFYELLLLIALRKMSERSRKLFDKIIVIFAILFIAGLAMILYASSSVIVDFALTCLVAYCVYYELETYLPLKSY